MDLFVELEELPHLVVHPHLAYAGNNHIHLFQFVHLENLISLFV